MSPVTTATSRTQKREAVSPARSPPPLAFQSEKLYPATTSTPLPLLDSSAEGPPGPDQVTTTSTTLPLERGGSWPPGHHIQHSPTSSRYERGDPPASPLPPPPSCSWAESTSPGPRLHPPTHLSIPVRRVRLVP